MKLLKVELYNFRYFERKTINFTDNEEKAKKFTVLIGNNAVGKTTILEGIAKGFLPILREYCNKIVNKKDFKDIGNLDICNGYNWTVIGITVEYNGRIYLWHNKRNRNRSLSTLDEIKEFVDLKQPKPFKDAILAHSNEKKRFPLVVYYSVNRMLVDIPSRRNNMNTGLEITEALESAFTTKNDFRRFYNWFKNEEVDESRKQRNNRDYKSIKLEAVRKGLNFFINGFTNLRIESSPSRMVMDDENGHEFNVSQFSGGYKAIFSLISDISSRLALANPESENPLENEALILIDELDLHLHPQWQKRIVTDLKRTFPNCQFIITTHSPFIIQTMRSDEVVNLDKEKTYHGNYIGWTLDEISEYEMLTKMNNQVSSEDSFDSILNSFQQAIKDKNVENAITLYRTLKNTIYPNNELDELMKLQLLGIGVDEI